MPARLALLPRVWRDLQASTPRNARLLLLPEPGHEAKCGRAPGPGTRDGAFPRLNGQPPYPPPALHAHSQEDADGKPARKHERAAVAEERKRNSGDRHEVERHADVHHHVNEPRREQSESHEAREWLIGAL